MSEDCTPATDTERVVIWSGEHRAYWRPQAAGYVNDIRDAGVYTRAEAEERTSHCGSEKLIELRPAPTDTGPTEGGLREALDELREAFGDSLPTWDELRALRAGPAEGCETCGGTSGHTCYDKAPPTEDVTCDCDPCPSCSPGHEVTYGPMEGNAGTVIGPPPPSHDDVLSNALDEMGEIYGSAPCDGCDDDRTRDWDAEFVHASLTVRGEVAALRDRLDRAERLVNFADHSRFCATVISAPVERGRAAPKCDCGFHRALTATDTGNAAARQP